jgi:hypothetical protein
MDGSSIHDINRYLHLVCYKRNGFVVEVFVMISTCYQTVLDIHISLPHLYPSGSKLYTDQ